MYGPEKARKCPLLKRKREKNDKEVLEVVTRVEQRKDGGEIVHKYKSRRRGKSCFR
jgi:hypothetical protein